MQYNSGIGGQAVLEGIMMRHKDKYAIAVRKPDKEIAIDIRDYKSVIGIKNLNKIPILRGVGAFLDSLVIGTSCLMWSARFFDDEEETAKAKTEEDKAKEERTWHALMTGTVIFSVLLSVGLFILLPYFLSSLLRIFSCPETLILLAEALLRIAIFLLYMVLISRMKDIQTVFAYHGAEHKCINCIEHGLPLTVENVLKSSRQHKRCGTSFLLLVVMISVICFLLLGIFGLTSPLLRIGIRLLMIPVIAGLAYEFLRFAGASSHCVVTVLSKPGLALQKMVTREPDASQVEVAIAAVEAVFDWKAWEDEHFPGGEGDGA